MCMTDIACIAVDWGTSRMRLWRLRMTAAYLPPDGPTRDWKAPAMPVLTSFSSVTFTH